MVKNEMILDDVGNVSEGLRQAKIPTPSDHQRDVVRGILQRGMELLDAKGHDYAGDDSAFINFTLTGIILDWAVSRGLQQEDLAFVSFIATKLARLIELRGSGKTPKNETIQDTCMDLANYAALWGGWILTSKTRAVPGKAYLLRGDETIDYAGMADAMERKKGMYPELDLEAAKEATGFAPVSEAPSGYTVRELRKMGWAEGEEGEYPDLDVGAAKEATGYVTVPTVKELKEAARLQAVKDALND